MPNRTFHRTLGRVLIGCTALFASAGAVDCSTYATASHDGTLGRPLASPTTGRVSARARGRTSIDQILKDADGTYIGRLLAERDSTLERWPDHAGRPLRVWIDSSSTIGGAQASFPAAVRAAFDEWAATGIPLRFTYVGVPNDADVRVHWTVHLDHKTGSTTWRTDHTGWLTSGDITLATHISDGQALDARGMRAIALHEVGHALGLSHSRDSHDIMASLVRVDGLSVPDRNTIRLLYSLPAGRVH
jgi:hypothetical protein